MESITVECRVPIAHIPAIKKTCKELGIDMITSEQDGECIVCHFLIVDYGTLISIGWIAGIEAYHTSISSPLKELMDDVQNKIDFVVNKQKNNE